MGHYFRRLFELSGSGHLISCTSTLLFLAAYGVVEFGNCYLFMFHHIEGCIRYLACMMIVC
jgi:hypothetical protein